MNGTLSLVGTPIGNLGDITLRAIETLKSADRIYAEDTRRTRVLLSHLGIEGKRLLSLHAHSTERDVATVVDILREGLKVALVTDAGMPSISDPGSALVRGAREAGVQVTSVPGPSAVTTAAALSGLVDGAFSFLGFLPRKGTKRRQMLEWVAKNEHPSILFESPHRIEETLKELLEVCGPDSMIAVCRELTKRFEEVQLVPLATAVELGCVVEPQGEFTIVLQGGSKDGSTNEPIDVDQRASELLEAGQSARDVSARIAREMTNNGQKVHKRDIYARVCAVREAREPSPAQEPELPTGVRPDDDS